MSTALSHNTKLIRYVKVKNENKLSELIMKIKVAYLEPNPFRDLDVNYFDEKRIKGLQGGF